jgi:H+/Cl- antiporter ClcA
MAEAPTTRRIAFRQTCLFVVFVVGGAVIGFLVGGFLADIAFPKRHFKDISSVTHRHEAELLIAMCLAVGAVTGAAMSRRFRQPAKS